MNRSPLAWDLVGRPPYLRVPRDGLDLHNNHSERDFADDLELPDLALSSSRSQSQSLSPSPSHAAGSPGSAGTALPSDGVLDVAGARGSHLLLHHDFVHDSIGYDSDSASASASASRLPSAASPPSSSRSWPSASPSPVLVDFDSASDLVGPASGSDLGSDSNSSPGSGPDSDPAPGSGLDSDLDVDLGQDTDNTGPASDPEDEDEDEDPGASRSSPNIDPLLLRPHHHLQFMTDINNDFFARSWHRLPPRPARPARASLTPDVNPNRRLPDNNNNHHHHHHHHYDNNHSNNNNNRHRRQALALAYSLTPRPIRHDAHLENHPSPPAAPANRRQPHLHHSETHRVSHPRPRSRTPPAPVAGRPQQRGHPRRHILPQQAAPAGAQGLTEYHDEDYHGVDLPHHPEGQDHPLREHLHLVRARRAARGAARGAARAAREAERQPRQERGNWRPQRPARRTAVRDPHEPESGQEDLDQSESMEHDDELVEVVYQRSAPAPPTPPRHQQRRARPQRQQHRHQHNHQQGHGLMEVGLDLDAELEQHVPVIDLTEEPDSPDVQRHRPINILRHNNHHHDHSHSHNHSHNRDQNHIHIFDDDNDNDAHDDEHDFIALYQPSRNTRRHMSQNGRMPSLNRSDGSILSGNAAAVIDLTLDSADDNIPANRRLPPPPAAVGLNQPASRNHRRLPAPASPAPAAAAAAAVPANRPDYQHLGQQLIGSIRGQIRGLFPNLLAHPVNNPREADIQFVGALPVPPFPMNPNPLAGNPPEFNYQANGFGGYGARQPTPKPDFQAPPPCRPGFTRDTRPEGGDVGADEELVVVCPSCDNELKYSPDEQDDNPRPAKKPRGKKSQEEHHFWAVKKCGHVYCKSCYDNRKKHSKGKDSAAAKTGFRFQPSETSKSIKIICAVDDCESEVSANAAWVGIFL